MSNRNSHANKQAARERMRAERERQAKKDKIRRQLMVGGGIIAVLAIAGGIGLAVAGAGGDGDEQDTWAKAKDAKLVKPANASGADGTTIMIGEKGAKNTLALYEDPRCPGCANFEQNVGDTVLKDIENGKYQATFHLGTFLDDNLQGTGSKNAVSAMGAALNKSPEAFLEYKKALYSKKYHPQESGPDKFADDAYLIKVADTVPALKGDKKFQKALEEGTYDRWALAMSEEFNKAKDVQSTPTVKLNGKILSADGQSAPSTPAQFNQLVGQGLKK